jgi:hypothetical protein
MVHIGAIALLEIAIRNLFDTLLAIFLSYFPLLKSPVFSAFSGSYSFEHSQGLVTSLSKFGVSKVRHPSTASGCLRGFSRKHAARFGGFIE